jgi:hypothetical protein
MADIPVTATTIADRMATVLVPGVANGDTVSITLPGDFNKRANPLPLDAGAPRYRLSVQCEGGAMADANCVVWAVAAPEIVLTVLAIAGPLTLFIIVENVHSIPT